MRIGELLIHHGLLEPAALDKGLRAQQQSNPRPRLGALLVRQGAVSESNLLAALSEQLGFPIWQASAENEGFQQRNALQAAQSKRWQAMLLPAGVPGSMRLIARDPLLTELQDHVHARFPARTLECCLASAQDISRALEHQAAHDGSARLHSGSSNSLRELAEHAPIVELVASLLAKGTDVQASDIHLEPTEVGFLIRYRVDGVLRHSEEHVRETFDAVVSRIKLVAGLDIAERRLPQDGRFSTRAAGIDTEIRVSVIPGVHGESIVMRLLPKSATRRFRIDALGFAEDTLAQLRKITQEPDGIFLVTGPTGSGKSTTLYATLASMDAEHTRILTVEDPVEYQLPGVTQFQVQADIGFNFPAALRAILRHDPDTIMVGEIRDTETAAIAIQASLTGHKVFSTLHTNDAPSAFVRLIDIGVEPFLLAASVRAVLAQRLIRRLCPHCAQPQPLGDVPTRYRAMADSLGLAAEQHAGRRPQACVQCDGVGYKGRAGVHELLVVTPELRQCLGGEKSSAAELQRHAQPGFRTLQADALIRYWNGETSLEEVAALGTSQQFD